MWRCTRPHLHPNALPSTRLTEQREIAFAVNLSTRKREIWLRKMTRLKGFEVGKDDYVVLEPGEVAAAVPESDKWLVVLAFISCADIDDYLAPADKSAIGSLFSSAKACGKNKVAAVARTVLFRRVRTMLIWPNGDGLIATTLNFDYEVRSANQAFAEVTPIKIWCEMLELAEHIIKTKRGHFDAANFVEALAGLVKAKLEGKKIEVPRKSKQEKVVDLMAALRG